ncbi:MAG TPA: DUF302 domain-containing protein [Burkholderiales bacterium]|nr:DUF302 domain-containing protein [Burkholderiales bacterium]
MKGWVRTALTVWLLAAAGLAWAAPQDVVLYSVKGNFDTVTQNVKFAIQGRGLVVDHVSEIGDMLARTGKDLGRTRRIYLHAEVVQFCSAVLSRNAMQADPRNIVFCPYAIAVYELPQEPGRIYLSYRRPEMQGSGDSMMALQAVDKLLDGIIHDALQAP